MKLMEKEDIAKIIDHTYLKASATEGDIRRVCQEAVKYNFRSVCIHPRWVKLAKEELRETQVKVVVVIDWPCGASPVDVRYFAAKIAKNDGADEADPVMDIGNFKDGNYELVLQDLKILSNILPCKVIIETGFLTDEEIKTASKLVKESGAICVKTSTGQDPKTDVNTKLLHIKLMREAVGPDFLIKAAGGVATLEDAQRMVGAGADIIGASSSLKILGFSLKEIAY